MTLNSLPHIQLYTHARAVCLRKRREKLLGIYCSGYNDETMIAGRSLSKQSETPTFDIIGALV